MTSSSQPLTFELSIPVSGLVLDSPTLRRRYVGYFASQTPTGAISETRTNMLGAAMGALQVAGRVDAHCDIRARRSESPSTERRVPAQRENNLNHLVSLSKAHISTSSYIENE